jgi:hypothetical protein
MIKFDFENDCKCEVDLPRKSGGENEVLSLKFIHYHTDLDYVGRERKTISPAL